MTTALGQDRAGINAEKVQKWFIDLQTFLESEVPSYENLLKDPRRIMNCDESGFPLQISSGKVLAPKGKKNMFIKLLILTKVR